MRLYYHPAQKYSYLKKDSLALAMLNGSIFYETFIPMWDLAVSIQIEIKYLTDLCFINNTIKATTNYCLIATYFNYKRNWTYTNTYHDII